MSVIGTARAFPFRLDFSWLPFTALLLWWLGTTAVPDRLPQQTVTAHWLLTGLLTVGFLVSVLFHELVHAALARRLGLEPEKIRLYPFGGLRQRDAAAGGAETEFMIALSGPVASATLTFLLVVSAALAEPGGIQQAVLNLLALFNGALTFLNLVPAFPLDAGRALRSALWALRGDFEWATAVASSLGGIAGVACITLGVFVILGNGAPAVGMMLLLIGLMLRRAVRTSYRHRLTRDALRGVEVAQLMDTNPITVQRAVPVDSLADDFIYRHQLKMLPVVDGDRLMGYVNEQQVKRLPREEWQRQSIGTIVLPASSDNTVSPSTGALEALDVMTRHGHSRLLVVDSGRLAGVIGLQDILERLQTAESSTS